MSDIPVGTPPVPPGRHAAPGGWYADPVDPARERYWDGWQWSRNTRPRDDRPPAYAAGGGPASAGPPAPGPPVHRGPGYPTPAYARPDAVAYTADGVPLAGWGWRVLAGVIDNLVVSVLVTVIAAPLWLSAYRVFRAWFEQVLTAQRTGGTVPPPLDPNSIFPAGDQMIITAVTLGVGMVYHVGFLRWRGATLGKLACRLRVVPVDRGRDPGPLSWNTVGVRAAIWVLPGITSLLALFTVLDALFPLWQPKRQALHDLAAKTQVIRQ